MDLYQAVAAFISQHQLADPSEIVVLGVSGGADSLCLMDVMHRLRYELVIAHLDHQLRPDSREDVEYVRDLADKQGLPFVSGEVDVPSLAEEGYSLEEAARQARYQFLIGVAERYSTSVIATGHTADDQVETVLMHLLRGAGPEGLSGMSPREKISDWVGLQTTREIYLVRPLLAVARSETVTHCAASGLNPLEDPTNSDPRFFRNRIRAELIPFLETYNPQIRKVLLRSSQVFGGLNTLVASEQKRIWKQVVRVEGESVLVFDRTVFNELAVALQRSTLRTLIRRLRPGLRDIPFFAVEALREAVLFDDRPARMHTSGGLEFLKFADQAVLRLPQAPIPFPVYPQMGQELPIPVELTGEIQLQEGWRIRAEEVKWSELVLEEIREAGRGMACAVPATRLGGMFHLRNPEPGDRFTSFGMQGRTKVSDIFINEKIPWPARSQWPIMVHEEEVVWIPGLRTSEHFRILPEESRIVIFRLRKPEVSHEPSLDGCSRSPGS